jgi:hypothetical protein
MSDANVWNGRKKSLDSVLKVQEKQSHNTPMQAQGGGGQDV